jgi:hypothetical protein
LFAAIYCLSLYHKGKLCLKISDQKKEKCHTRRGLKSARKVLFDPLAKYLTRKHSPVKVPSLQHNNCFILIFFRRTVDEKLTKTSLTFFLLNEQKNHFRQEPVLLLFFVSHKNSLGLVLSIQKNLSN